MLSIRNNMLAQNANRQLNASTKKNAKNTEKLSSGYKINRAADDAAGLAVSEKMRRQIRGLHQGAENIQDGIGYVKTADGALNEAQDILQRINELAVKAANGTNTQEDRAYIDQEIQALKAELSRIFGTTSYNERFIWEPSGVDKVEGVGGVGGVNPDREIIGWVEEQAASFRSTSGSIPVTNDNCGVIALGSYVIHADLDQGVWVTWTGYDGGSYKTEPISWDEFKENNYRFDMADYFGEKTNNKLYDANGDPVFRHEIALSVHEKATIEDIIACIDGRTMTSSPSARLTAQSEDASGASVNLPAGVSVSAWLDYRAAYASHHKTGTGENLGSDNGLNFDGTDDAFFEPRDADGNEVQNQGSSVSGSNLTSKPSASTIEDARESKEGWEFSFYLDGIGTVTAKSTSVTYYSYDRDADDENIFWEWHGVTTNGVYNPHDHKDEIGIRSDSHGGGTLGDVMDALTGKKGADGTPGLLSKKNGGDADSGGYIYLRFELNAENKYKYGTGGETDYVGYFTIRIEVTNENTEGEILFDKIQQALKDETIFDLYSSGSSEYFYTPTAVTHKIPVEPIYADDDPTAPPAESDEETPMCGFFVQAGPEAGMHINIEYEALSLKSLGMVSTNVLTAEDAGRAIDSVKIGLEIVSSQRADFGAYQNRLEHAYNINQNSEENTQYAEYQIRDTDIAKLMVEYANQNILNQAGTSMLAQANQQPGLVMQLLQ